MSDELHLSTKSCWKAQKMPRTLWDENVTSFTITMMTNTLIATEISYVTNHSEPKQLESIVQNDMSEWGFTAAAIALFCIGFFGFFLNLFVIALMCKDTQVSTYGNRCRHGNPLSFGVILSLIDWRPLLFVVGWQADKREMKWILLSIIKQKERKRQIIIYTLTQPTLSSFYAWITRKGSMP